MGCYIGVPYFRKPPYRPWSLTSIPEVGFEDYVVEEGLASKMKCLGLEVLQTAIVTQRLQYPLIKEYTLNHIRDPPTNAQAVIMVTGRRLSGFRLCLRKGLSKTCASISPSMRVDSTPIFWEAHGYLFVCKLVTILLGAYV